MAVVALKDTQQVPSTCLSDEVLAVMQRMNRGYRALGFTEKQRMIVISMLRWPRDWSIQGLADETGYSRPAVRETIRSGETQLLVRPSGQGYRLTEAGARLARMAIEETLQIGRRERRRYSEGLIRLIHEARASARPGDETWTLPRHVTI